MVRALPSCLLAGVVVLGATPAEAWQQASEADGAQAQATTGGAASAGSPPVRRVRRLGDVETEEYDLELAPPPAPTIERRDSALYNLPDPTKNERLQTLLSRIAVSDGDPRAQAELDRLLTEVIDDAYRLMDARDLDGASQMLSVVRNINPNKEGLKAAQDSLAAREVSYPYLPDGVLSSGQKLNTVESVSPYRLPQESQTRRLDELLSILAARPSHLPAYNELNELLDDVLLQADRATEAGDFSRAEQLLSVVRTVKPRKRGLGDARQKLARYRQVDELLRRAEAAERQGHTIEPLMNSAYYYYRKALAEDPGNASAERGLRNIQQLMLVNALDAARNYDFELAEDWLAQASAVREDQAPVEQARREIAAFEDESAAAIEQEVRAAIARGEYEYAEFRLIDLIALGGHEDKVASLRALITREEVYGAYQPGQVIRDPLQGLAGAAPPVVVIGAGSFLMGAAREDRDARDSETPQHRVSIDRGFAMGQREISVGEFRAFVRSSGHRTTAERTGQSSIWDDALGRLAQRENVNWRHDFQGQPAEDSLPVVHVSWDDAQAYVRWLSRATGHRYRLPTEAEFEYALRAGSRDAFWWGSGRPREQVENIAGDRDQSEQGRRFSKAIRGYGDDYFGPAPTGLFQPNPWGLHDMAGNVTEWVQDCWHANYVRAPSNGAAWENPGCPRRVVRGGYWASSEDQVRSASRSSAPQDLHASQLGFRVVREL